MKYLGKVINAPTEEIIVIPRTTGNITLKIQAVLDFDEFEALCPTPEPPVKMVPGGAKIANAEAPSYLEAIDAWASKKSSWLILKALQATSELEFETVNMSDPETFNNYDKEFRAAGFSSMEIAMIVNKVTDTCGLNSEKVEAATKAFLAGQELPQDM
ncbi:MAG: hypothetical protein DRN30_05235 [Thermoplasmata archaeon]|nr:MAG: hypothetical protein DRN30_05235 [Thermoplasmata archaeon]